MCNRLIEISNLYEDKNELNSLRKWTLKSTVNDYNCFNVNGIGFTTFRYIKILLGANTVKLDVHIKNKISKIIGRKTNEKSTVELFESARNELKLNVTYIEYYYMVKSFNDSKKII